MDLNHISAKRSVSNTERFRKSCSLFADPSSRRVRRQHPLPGCPSTQFSSVPYAREDNVVMKTKSAVVKTPNPNTIAAHLRTSCGTRLLPLLLFLLVPATVQAQY